jgi:hypothetical protein
MASARSIIRALTAFARAVSSGSSGSSQEEQVEVAVADMADDAARAGPRAESAFGLEDALGQARDRHADIGREPRQPGAAPRGPVGVVARLPERLRSSGLVAQAKPPPPMSAAIASTVSACSFTPAGLPWNSKKRVGCLGSPRASSSGCRPRIWTSSSSSIRATGMPDLDGGDHGVHRASRSGKAQTAAEIASGMPCRRSRPR